MKIALTISLALNLLLIFLIWEQKTTDSVKLRTVESEVRYHKHLADSASLEKQLTKDSLEIAFATIRNLNGEKEHERELRIKAEKKLRDIKFVNFKTDLERDSVLKVLYPSIK